MSQAQAVRLNDVSSNASCNYTVENDAFTNYESVLES
jgi:hypothetical protein